jgi:hypothetical protein
MKLESNEFEILAVLVNLKFAIHSAAQPSVPSLLKAAQSAAYWCVRSKICCGRLVAWMMLRTLTAPSSSMSFRMAYRRSGENWRHVSLSWKMKSDW